MFKISSKWNPVYWRNYKNPWVTEVTILSCLRRGECLGQAWARRVSHAACKVILCSSRATCDLLLSDTRLVMIAHLIIHNAIRGYVSNLCMPLVTTTVPMHTISTWQATPSVVMLVNLGPPSEALHDAYPSRWRLCRWWWRCELMSLVSVALMSGAG